MKNLLLAVLVVALFISGAGWWLNADERKTLADDLDYANDELASKRLEVSGLASELKVSESIIAELRLDAAVYAKLLAEANKKAKAIQSHGDDLVNQSIKLRASADVQTKSWAAGPLPDDARRLLKQALRGPDGHSHSHSAGTAAGKSVTGLPSQRF